MIREAASLLLDSARMLGRAEPLTLLLVMVVGILLAALAWWGAVNYTKLWNLRFEPNAIHHAACGFAALLTLMATISFVALGQAKAVATKRILAWEKALASDFPYEIETGIKAYYRVKSSGLEVFDPKVHFASPGKSFFYPVTRDETRRLAASVFLDAAIANFRVKHPYLHRVIWKRTEVPYQRVVEDRATYQGSQYPTNRYFIVAAREILRDVEPQTPRVVGSARRWLAVFFLLAQAVPFSVIGWAAYRDLKETH